MLTLPQNFEFFIRLSVRVEAGETLQLAKNAGYAGSFWDSDAVVHFRFLPNPSARSMISPITRFADRARSLSVFRSLRPKSAAWRSPSLTLSEF